VIVFTYFHVQSHSTIHEMIPTQSSRHFTESIDYHSARNPDGAGNQPWAQFTMACIGMSKSVAGKERGLG
jgi:hypothetical protein